MSRSGGQSEARPPVFKSSSKLGTHLLTHCSRDERHSQPYPARECNPDVRKTGTDGSDVVQSGRSIFDDFFQHLWPYIGNNTVNVVFQMVKRLWLIRIDQ
ncbi:hypothetical protein TNCV_3837441 [Trichonephila clavipes]|nr:hypothetical protein TNCV_3837441 [Trichonephila clavipes]